MEKSKFHFGPPVANPRAKDILFPVSGLQPVGIGLNISSQVEKLSQAGIIQSKASIIKATLNARQLVTVNTEAPLKQVGVSMFGTKVVSDLDITGGEYKNQKGEVIGRYEDIKLDAVLMTVTTGNRLAITETQGRDWDVVEYVAKKSPRIKIEGGIYLKEPGLYPYNAIRNLSTACDSNLSLRVNSWYLNAFGIYNLYVIDAEIPQGEGTEEYQRFKLECIAVKKTVLRIQ